MISIPSRHPKPLTKNPRTYRDNNNGNNNIVKVIIMISIPSRHPKPLTKNPRTYREEPLIRSEHAPPAQQKTQYLFLQLKHESTG